MRILVRPPAPEDVGSWERLGWRAAPDFAWLAREHEAFRTLLAGAGAEVVEATGEPGNLDSVYVYDPSLVTPDGGAILLRPGKEGRLREPEALGPDLEAAGLRILGRLEPPETADGGDTIWLDEKTLLVGRSYRTNDAGIEAIRRLLPGTEVVAFDLPHMAGREEVLHLRSLLSPLGDNAFVAHRPLLPARLVELLEERGVEIVGVPADEVETMGPNVLAVAPRVVVALAGNDRTRARLERAGFEVLVYRATRSRARATAGRPASPCRCQSQPDGLLRGRRAQRPLHLPARLEHDDRPPEREREADLGERPVAAADGDHRVAGRDDREVPRVADAGDDDVVEPLVRARPRLAREDPDRRAACALRAARGGRHHLAEPAGDDGRAASASSRPTCSARSSCSAPLPMTETWIATCAMLEARDATRGARRRARARRRLRRRVRRARSSASAARRS